jgi:hypothetical protein
MRRSSTGLGWLLALSTGCGSSVSPPAPAPGRADAGVDRAADTASAIDARVGAVDPSPYADAGSMTADAAPPGVDGPAVAVDGAPSPTDARTGFIPRPTGPCPQLAPGMVTVRPGGVARNVRVWMSDAARTLDGPLVFFWYGTNGSPAQAEQALGPAALASITAAGGLVVAPVHDPAAGTWPWFLVSGTRDDDLRVADEVLACAVEGLGVDLRRIHSMGFSAGAIHTVQMSYRRSGYLASVVTYSGAKSAAIQDQDPSNKLAAMIFHGGPSDRVIIGFQAGSQQYKRDLEAAGRFALICDHGLGHRIPVAAAAGVWRFLQDHPLGRTPPPYAAGLPPEIPDYCSR